MRCISVPLVVAGGTEVAAGGAWRKVRKCGELTGFDDAELILGEGLARVEADFIEGFEMVRMGLVVVVVLVAGCVGGGDRCTQVIDPDTLEVTELVCE
ncbi:hypothetical protein [Gymnodinialimonas hymeniacidonis]|uniref:hypothetical protein n=1 Tax=Gymnodinialimonas hymeniacidonis TaxID=3126508 RepID=UPI0034C5B426